MYKRGVNVCRYNVNVCTSFSQNIIIMIFFSEVCMLMWISVV